MNASSAKASWVIEQSKELKQTIISGQGEFHLRTLKWRIENNDKLPIEFLEPKIPYRETITKAARADYRHKKQSGGAGQFGEVHLIVEPYYEGMPAPDVYRFGGQEYKISVRDTQIIDLEWGGKLVFINSIVGGSIDARFMPAILKGIMSVLKGASAAALYGSRAGNGVILITTKTGKKSDGLGITVTSSVSAETLFLNPELQNSFGQGSLGVYDELKTLSWGPKIEGQSYKKWDGSNGNMATKVH